LEVVAALCLRTAETEALTRPFFKTFSKMMIGLNGWQQKIIVDFEGFIVISNNKI